MIGYTNFYRNIIIDVNKVQVQNFCCAAQKVMIHWMSITSSGDVIIPEQGGGMANTSSNQSQQNNPFAEAFKVFGDWGSSMNSMKSWNSLDMNNFAVMQGRNVETVSAANQAAAEGMQAIMRRQAEIIQSGASELFQLIKDVSVSTSQENAAAKQAAFMKLSVESAVSDARELAEMANKSAMEVFDIIGSRAAENISECATTCGTGKKKAA